MQMRAVWASGVLAAGLFVGVFCYLSPLRPGVIALQFAWQPQTFGGIIHLWSDADLARYRSHLPLDFMVLLAYAVFGWLLATRTRVFLPLAPAARLFARMCLPLAAVFDAMENALHWWLTAVPRFDTPGTYMLSTTCSALKWALLIAFGALVLYAQARAED
jgi:hypothetical protein